MKASLRGRKAGSIFREAFTGRLEWEAQLWCQSAGTVAGLTNSISLGGGGLVPPTNLCAFRQCQCL